MLNLDLEKTNKPLNHDPYKNIIYKAIYSLILLRAHKKENHKKVNPPSQIDEHPENDKTNEKDGVDD